MGASECQRTVRGAVLLAVVLALAACATKGDIRSLQQEIRDVADRQQQALVALQRQTRLTQDSQRGTTDQLFDIRGTVAGQLGQILDRLGTIAEQVGENQRGIRALRDQIESLRRLALAGARPVVPGATSEAGTPTGGGSTEATDELYNAANDQFVRNNLRTAREGFELFLRQYPSDELAPFAQYNLADILVRENRPREAIEAFERIRETHPAATKVADALYRIGVLYMELEEDALARRYLETVVNTYPESGMADLARDRLREIGG